jgi:hypothetical protein
MNVKPVNPSRVILWIVLLGLLLAACQPAANSAASSGNSGQGKGLQVVVIYLNHPPVRPIVQEIDQTLAGYGDKVSVTKYDFDSPDGEAYAKKMKLTGHIPIAVFIDGSETFDVSGRKVKFESFPQGEGTGMVPDGAWTMTDLDTVLKTKLGE